MGDVVARTEREPLPIQIDRFFIPGGFASGGERAKRAVTGLALFFFLLSLLLQSVSFLSEPLGLLPEPGDFSALLLQLGIIEETTGRQENKNEKGKRRKGEMARTGNNGLFHAAVIKAPLCGGAHRE